jgi:putative transposase
LGHRGNPYDNTKAESFMKTLKVEAAFRAAQHRGHRSNC